jgi:hypothetical protein
MHLRLQSRVETLKVLLGSDSEALTGLSGMSRPILPGAERRIEAGRSLRSQGGSSEHHFGKFQPAPFVPAKKRLHFARFFCLVKSESGNVVFQ